MKANHPSRNIVSGAAIWMILLLSLGFLLWTVADGSAGPCFYRNLSELGRCALYDRRNGKPDILHSQFVSWREARIRKMTFA